MAAKPPRTIFRPIAARPGRTIMYVPIGQLSPVSLKKIRVVHVLDGYDKREIARDYIRYRWVVHAVDRTRARFIELRGHGSPRAALQPKDRCADRA